MSITFQNENGAWKAVECSREPVVRAGPDFGKNLLKTSVALALAGGFCSMIASSKVSGSAVTQPEILSNSRPEQPPAYDMKRAPGALRFALDRFQRRGGRYVYGPNDCSTFLTDYLKASGLKIGERTTTANLMKLPVAKSLGLKVIPRHDFSAMEGNIVIVFRYLEDGRVYGHCGIRLIQDGKHFWAHNNSSDGGVSIDPEEKFLLRVRQSGPLNSRIYRLPDLR